MANVKLTIHCGGKELNVHSLSLQQKMDWHHSFRIAVASESLEGKKAINIDNSIDFLGKTVEISISPKKQLSGDGLNFKGMVTSVHIDRTFTDDNLIILTGYSPTYLLEDGLGCQSFEEKKGDEIFKDIVGNYPSNLLNPSGSGNYTNPIPYMVRYKETNFQFLSRLAAMYGEWLYYTGQNFIYGQIQETNQVEIILGTDLQSYEYGVTMKPANFDWLSYDYTKNNQFSKSSNAYKPATLDVYGKKALNVANSNFPGGHKIPTMYDIREERHLKERIEINKTSILGDTSTFSGQSTNPSLTIGTNLSVYANNKVDGAFKKTFINRFRVIGVQHHVNQNKDYQNSFEALPFECTLPPVNSNVFKPEAEKHIAIVKENNDPDKLGRVRVQFNWQNGNDLTPWIRVSTAHASGDRGIYFTPEIGDEVMVDFEQANPNQPYVCDTLYHGKTKPEWADPDNNLKAIKTRSGHTILLDDTDGNEVISISDKSNNLLKFDTKEKTITISSEKKLILESEEIEITASKNMKVKAGQNMEVSASQDLKQKGNNVEVGAAQNLKLSGDMGAELVTNMKVEISGKTGASLTSDVSTEVGGTATLDLKSSGITQLKGSLVKIN